VEKDKGDFLLIVQNPKKILKAQLNQAPSEERPALIFLSFFGFRHFYH